MPSQVTNYQCPACNGPLRFDEEFGDLVCDYCESRFEVEEIEKLYASKDEKASEAFTGGSATATAPDQGKKGETLKEEQKHRKEETEYSRWDGGTISEDWGEATDNLRTYNCPSCGAELICEVTTAATHCPYCGNPSIVPGQFAGAQKPDYVIPFKMNKEQAEAALKRHYAGKLFLPKTFSDNNQIKKLQGVYVPFWLFNVDVDASVRFNASNSSTHREGDYRVTVTEHYHVEREGTVKFNRIPADGSNNMPDDLMDSLEPFDYDELKEFSTAYLPGFLAEKYDVSIEENVDRIKTRCENSAQDEMRNDVHGYEMVNIKSSSVDYHQKKVDYALLPVYMLKTEWQGKSYLFAMNGQTGKLVGDLPVSKKRYSAWFWGITAALTAAFYVSGIGGILGNLVAFFL